MEEKKFCIGCGLPLQSDDPNQSGYLPPLVLKRGGDLLCKRCFRLQHYSEEKETQETVPSLVKALEMAKKKHPLVLYVIDLFAFESSFDTEINKVLNGMDVLLIANKRDVLPKSVKDEKLLRFVKSRAEEAGLSVKQYIIISARKQWNIDEVIKNIELSGKRDIFVIGATSSGKSTLINRFLKVYKNETTRYISTSVYPGTTLRNIVIPLQGGYSLIDTPGLVRKDNMIMHLSKSSLMAVTPKKEIKPKGFTLVPGQALFFGNLAIFDFKSGKKTNFVCYSSREVLLHRGKDEDLETLQQHLIENKQVAPVEKKWNFRSLRPRTFHAEGGEKVDIGIQGLGWISFKAEGQEIVVYTLPGIEVYLGKAKI